MKIRLAAGFVCSVLVASCTSAAAPHDTLYQVSVIDALLARDYDGEFTLDELLRHGNFGLGTFDRLDGEMIVLNGRVYRAAVDGTVERPPLTETTPWAVVTNFRTESQLSIDHPMTIEELEAKIDAGLANPNIFYALRIETRLPTITIRSVGRQSKPYPDLVSVAQGQKTWKHDYIKGTLVGIRSPDYVGTTNVPGYHWHFISADREVGGHVVAAALDRGAVDIDHIRAWEVVMPEGVGFGTLDLGASRIEDLETVEK